MSAVTGQEGELAKAEALIRVLQDELAATNQEVLVLTLDLEQRVAERTAELSQTNQELVKEIAERKRAEEEVNRLNQALERRATLLETANSELEAFSYSVSHDLRAPLRHISGFADMLQEDAADALDENARLYLNKIRTAAEKMATLIEELLRFSRLSRTQLSWASLDVNKLIDDVLADFQPEIGDRNVVWKRTRLPKVTADAPMLRQVFVNLISNALKYTRPREQAEIEIGCTDRAADTVFFVRDNGVGFDPQYAKNLFGVFQRLHGEKEFEGVGIGLANVRRIVARHGGKTWAEGTLGEGATIYFSLPKNPPVAESH